MKELTFSLSHSYTLYAYYSNSVYKHSREKGWACIYKAHWWFHPKRRLNEVLKNVDRLKVRSDFKCTRLHIGECDQCGKEMIRPVKFKGYVFCSYDCQQVAESEITI